MKNSNSNNNNNKHSTMSGGRGCDNKKQPARNKRRAGGKGNAGVNPTPTADKENVKATAAVKQKRDRSTWLQGSKSNSQMSTDLHKTKMSSTSAHCPAKKKADVKPTPPRGPDSRPSKQPINRLAAYLRSHDAADISNAPTQSPERPPSPMTKAMSKPIPKKVQGGTERRLVTPPVWLQSSNDQHPSSGRNLLPFNIQNLLKAMSCSRP